MFDEEEIKEVIDRLIIAGYIEVTGIDSETGEFLYQVSPSLYQQIPDLGERLQAAFLDEVYNLWVKGMVNMDTTLENPIVSLTENAFNQEKVAELTVEERHTLFTVMQAMREE